MSTARAKDDLVWDFSEERPVIERPLKQFVRVGKWLLRYDAEEDRYLIGSGGESQWMPIETHPEGPAVQAALVGMVRNWIAQQEKKRRGW